MVARRGLPKVQVYLPEPVVVELNRLAAQHFTSISELVRRAVVGFVNELRKRGGLDPLTPTKMAVKSKPKALKER